jgi:hypothetical protein
MVIETTVPAESPEEVVRRVIGALNVGRWSLVAECAHDASLERFRRWELRLLQAHTGSLPSTPDELAEDLPGAPESVLDWFMDQEAASLASERQRWPSGLLGVDSVDALVSLPAAELFVRWLAASYEGAIPWQVPPSQQEPHLNRVVIGVAREVRVSELLAHVVYRQHDDPSLEGSVRLTTVRYAPGGWRIDATDAGLLLPAYLL